MTLDEIRQSVIDSEIDAMSRNVPEAYRLTYSQTIEDIVNLVHRTIVSSMHTFPVLWKLMGKEEDRLDYLQHCFTAYIKAYSNSGE